MIGILKRTSNARVHHSQIVSQICLQHTIHFVHWKEEERQKKTFPSSFKIFVHLDGSNWRRLVSSNPSLFASTNGDTSRTILPQQRSTRFLVPSYTFICNKGRKNNIPDRITQWRGSYLKNMDFIHIHCKISSKSLVDPSVNVKTLSPFSNEYYDIHL
jgi:hypothetical protein